VFAQIRDSTSSSNRVGRASARGGPLAAIGSGLEQFHKMPVGILDENLSRAIGSAFSGEKSRRSVTQVGLPGVDVIDGQREVCATMMGTDFRDSIANQVQFLLTAQAKPGARKIEVGPSDLVEFQGLAIELAARVEVGDVQRNMV